MGAREIRRLLLHERGFVAKELSEVAARLLEPDGVMDRTASAERSNGYRDRCLRKGDVDARLS